ncbi:MAG TPA: ferrochelatase [Acidimicrobiales bacterium]|nr:ferrochelatase [Acidimicrobiales bacterium]
MNAAASPSPSPIGVLVMAHGTPATPQEIEPFYTSIRRGRPPTPELLADLVRRYDALGGASPLAERTRRQVEGLAATLEVVAPGDYTIAYGAKHTTPRIEEGVAVLRDRNVEQIIGLVLTPHQSSLGSGEYLRRAGEAAGVAGATTPPTEFVAIPSWHRAPGLAALLADRTRAALESLTPAQRQKTTVFFTAHSLPEKAVADGDPYPDQVQQSASDIADLLGFDPGSGSGSGPGSGPAWGVAWQSPGRTADPWMGPDLVSEIRRVAADGATSVVVCPVGFVSDHLEILYDLDIEAADVARSLGMAFTRTASLNDDPGFLRILADVVRATTTPTTR